MFADGDTHRSVLVDPEQQPVSDSEEVISSHVSQYSSLTSASHGTTRVYQLSTAATGFTEIHQLFTYPNSASTNTTTSTTKH